MSTIDDLALVAGDDPTPEQWDRLEEMANAIAAAVDLKGQYHDHSLGVARLARVIGVYMGIRGPGALRLKLAGLLHDVGKLRVPDHVLLKPGSLTAQEYDVVKQHSMDGHAMLQALGLHAEARWVLHHHERGDGTGYPTGLAGAAIPLGARILAVADAYDCITTARVYDRARSHEDALVELHLHAGTQFDPAVVAALTRALETRATLL